MVSVSGPEVAHKRRRVSRFSNSSPMRSRQNGLTVHVELLVFVSPDTHNCSMHSVPEPLQRTISPERPNPGVVAPGLNQIS